MRQCAFSATLRRKNNNNSSNNHKKAMLRCSWAWLMAALFVLDATAAASCVDGNSLQRGDGDDEAIVYVAQCNARHFRVRVVPGVERSLNLSYQQIVTVQNYPVVSKM